MGGNPTGATVYPYELMNISFSSITGLSNLTVYFDNPDNSTGDETGNGLPIAEQTGNYTDVINDGGTNTGTGSSQGGIWTIMPDAGTATYDATLYGRNYSNDAGAGNYYSVLKRTTYSTCGSAQNWALSGSVSTNSLTSNVITAKRTGMSGFSQMAIAKHSTPLPIGLMDFSAKCDNDKTTIKWKTATEDNNNYFTIERSSDGNHFTKLTTILGAGNSSSILNYLFMDNDPLAGTSYYRLSQTDYNGSSKSYAPVSSNCVDSESSFSIRVNGNPVTNGKINLSVNGSKDENILFVLTDVLGREVYSKAIAHEDGNFIITIFPDTKLEAGIYFVTASSQGKLMSKKIIVK